VPGEDVNNSDNATARRLPAEWEPQDGVMLTWPHEQGDWRPFLPEVEPVYVALASAISERERLVVCVLDEQHRRRVRSRLDAAGVATGRAQLCIAPSDDSWTRDHGPLTVCDGGAPRLLDFRFNGWGGKYPAERDDRISATLAAAGVFGATPFEAVDFVLEGGAIESDGNGVLLTTSSCLLAPGRNPRFTRAQIEQRLAELFGLRRVLWLEHGHLEGDDTDGHIDTLARFCDAGTIAYVRCEDPRDAHYPALAAMEQELMALRDMQGEPYRLVALPWPAAKRNAAGKRLPATYANFLVINGAVLVPVYRDPADRAALERIAQCFPGREAVAIDCLPLIQQYGSLHCITMQLPAGVLAPL
jgi:agmatine/peptidylarginine deiminase